MLNNHHLIAVIIEKIFEYEYRIMLEKIMSQNYKYNMYTIIISICDFKEYCNATEIENKIYNMIKSPRIDGIIFISESISNSELKKNLIQKMKKLKIPIIIAGDEIVGFTSVNNNVRNDFREITNHLINEHRIFDIDILITGKKDEKTSIACKKGVYDALDVYGIKISTDRFIYGCGKTIAKDYITGQKRIPKAIICTNDNIAYDLLDTLFDNDIKLLDDITIIGYKYSGNRFYHSPILTTYDRKYDAVGAKAVTTIYYMITMNATPNDDILLKGCIIRGDTCSCGVEKRLFNKELCRFRTEHFQCNIKNIYCNQLKYKLNFCHSIDDYIKILANHTYFLDNIKKIYLCLYENWYLRTEKKTINNYNHNETMIAYRVIDSFTNNCSPIFFQSLKIFPDNILTVTPQFIHIIPISVENFEIGHFIIMYDKPQVYDSIFQKWVDVAINALNIIRIKNNIIKFLEYNKLSLFHDSAIGIYNKIGFFHEFNHILSCSSSLKNMLSVIMIKIHLITHKDNYTNIKINSIRIDTEVSSCLKKLCINSNGICAKFSEKYFIFASTGNFTDDFHKIIIDRISVIITHSPIYSHELYTNMIITTGITIPLISLKKDTKFSENLIDKLKDIIDAKSSKLEENLKNKRFNMFLNIKTKIYKTPNKNWNAAIECRNMHMSYGYFRTLYKQIFNVSFHHDVIISRIELAKYLLITTNFNLNTIAFRCGYEDDKYFIRQFHKITGISPNIYRKFEIQ